MPYWPYSTWDDKIFGGSGVQPQEGTIAKFINTIYTLFGGKQKIIEPEIAAKTFYKSRADYVINGKIKDDNDQLIMCRHLAFEQLKHDKDYHTLFSSKESIQSIPALMKNQNKEYHLKANSFHSFSVDQFGNCLNKMCQAMQAGAIKKIILFTPNHNMALTVKVKETGVVIKFYDPNDGDSHRRALCRDIEAVKQLEISHFITRKICLIP